ncbi:hypothetical protein ACPPVO_35055 [Dactylosporangium sp. McL0621]|uniref:hypothetical protein n=1 Tax=Dactylosporangium sp. McL0621 TaxID=3415678 RepID=UPI003CF38DA2
MTERWTLISERQALAHAGAGVEVRPGERVSYALGADATVVVLDAGDRPDGTGVWSRDEVVLRGVIPGSAHRWMDAGAGDEPVILGFVRLPAGCLPLGRLQVSQCSIASVTHNSDQPPLSECVLRLDERLPWHLLDLVRPMLPEDLPGPTWMTCLPHDPIRAMHEFVAGWYADIPAVSHETVDLPLQLPEPLSEFYRAAAGRGEVLGREELILSDPRLRHEGGLLLFAAEDDGELVMLIDPTDAEPEVLYGRDRGETADEVVSTQQPLSGFLLHFLLRGAAIGSPFAAVATVTDEQARQIGRRLRLVPLGPIRWRAVQLIPTHRPTGSTHHYVGPGVVVTVRDQPDGSAQVWAGSRWRSALRPLRQLGFEWHAFSG